MSNRDDVRRTSAARLPQLQVDFDVEWEPTHGTKDDALLTAVSTSTVSGFERWSTTRTEQWLVETQDQSPPVDGGRDAWLFLVGAFIVEAMVWGFPLGFGIFQQYYTTHEPFSKDASKVAIIGDTATGALYFGGLVTTPLLKKWPSLLRPFVWAGFPMIALGLVAASFARSVDQLIITQGVLTCFGGWMVFYPTQALVDDWFVRRKGLAFGVMYAGTGGAGIVVPYVLNFLVSTYGYRTTLRVWAIVLVVFTPCVYWVRPRTPSHSLVPQFRGLKFLRMSPFWLLLIGLMIQSLGFPCPSVYLPTFAVSLGRSLSMGTLLVSLFNAATIFSTLLTGMLIDRFHVTTIIMVMSMGAMASVLVFWGCTVDLGMAIVFALSYGLFAGGYCVGAIAGSTHSLKVFDTNLDVGAVQALLLAGKGIGIVLSGPLSEAIFTSHGWNGDAKFAYGTSYGPLIVFTGVTAGLGGISFIGRGLKWT